MIYVELQMGFFAEAGPVQIFVSNHVSIIPHLLLCLPEKQYECALMHKLSCNFLHCLLL